MPSDVHRYREESVPLRETPITTNERPFMQDSLRAGSTMRDTYRGPGDGVTSRKWLFVALGIGAIVILSSVALSLMFAGATVTVYPKQDTVVVNTTFTASQGKEENVLAFERVVIERTANRSVAALGEEQVEERAEGTITIYNEYSTTPQRLIKRTRFATPDGRIYRIQNAVEIPGKKSDDTPGSVEALVVAEEPGESYNISGPQTFSVPGFAGTPQEGKVYAKSTADFTGGFAGIRRTIDEGDRATALEQLETQLRDELMAAAFNGADQPPGQYLSKDAVFFEFTTLPDELVEPDKVTLSLSGKLHGVLFPVDEFASRLAHSTLASYGGEQVRVDNPDELMVKLEPVQNTETPEAVAPWQAETYNVQVEGKARFIWEFDADALAEDLAGMDKVILDAPYEGGILESYVGIDRLQASVRPFWKKSFPGSPEDIVVLTALDE